MSGPFPSTDDNAVPNVDGTDLGDLLEDLRGIHPGIDLMLDGARLIAHDRHNLNMTQVLVAVLAGSPDALDVTSLPGLLVERLTNPDTNPAVRSLPLDQQKDAAHQGWLTAHNLADPDLRDTTARACAALDPRKDHMDQPTDQPDYDDLIADTIIRDLTHDDHEDNTH
ncbi:hypothetical protein [Streptomyces sp. NPDC048521]|uniref:hypothetical protein n=1 Tax=Streptomyces sp. NPDC048521 TaxID=3365566 RepID=UPI003713F79E